MNFTPSLCAYKRGVSTWQTLFGSRVLLVVLGVCFSLFFCDIPLVGLPYYTFKTKLKRSSLFWNDWPSQLLWWWRIRKNRWKEIREMKIWLYSLRYTSVCVHVVPLELHHCIIVTTIHVVTRMLYWFSRFNINKKAVLSQRWPRDERYISRSWGVVEIWPFEIIQAGGAILNLFEPKIAPLDPPSPKTLP